MKFGNGDLYNGDFQEGLFNGHGVYYFSNGTCYEGNWKDDLMHGQGTIV